jgi:hypothetical protein
VDTGGAALVGVGGSVIGGFIGSLAAWFFARTSGRLARLSALYWDWSVACHRLLTLTRDLVFAVAGTARTNSATYEKVASPYLLTGQERRYYDEYLELSRAVDLAAFQIEMIDVDGGNSVQRVKAITSKISMFNILSSEPNVDEPTKELEDFNKNLLSRRFRL